MQFNNDPIAHSALLLTESNKLFDIIIDNLIDAVNNIISEYNFIIIWDPDPILLSIIKSTILYLLQILNKLNLTLIQSNTSLYVGLETIIQILLMIS
jgi:hypothetical protein